MATIDEFVLKKILVFDESTESVDIATNREADSPEVCRLVSQYDCTGSHLVDY
jgi:hypothetical protein